MQEKVGDLWLESAEYRCILTHGTLTREGEATLDTLSAKQAAERYHGLALDLGRLISARGNHAHLIRPGLVCFPTRQYQWAKPSPPTIERSARELMEIVGTAKTLLPLPGCDEGELDWATLAPQLSFLPDNVIIIRRP